MHSAQPLSYIANLIRAEGPRITWGGAADDSRYSQGRSDGREEARYRDPTGYPPITFHTSLQTGRRWSPSTGIGDFLREAARVGSFVIRIGADTDTNSNSKEPPRNAARTIRVVVPSFEERTAYLRAALYAKMSRIEDLTKVKDECDRLARQATQRVAFAGAGMLGVWWVTVGVLTFSASLSLLPRYMLLNNITQTLTWDGTQWNP